VVSSRRERPSTQTGPIQAVVCTAPTSFGFQAIERIHAFYKNTADKTTHEEKSLHVVG